MAVKVKKLEWTQYPDGGLQAMAPRWNDFVSIQTAEVGIAARITMGDGGKDAAQTWFDEAILSAIEEA